MLGRITLAGLAGLLLLVVGVATASASAKRLKPSGEATAHRVGPNFPPSGPSSKAEAQAPPVRPEHPNALAEEKRQAAREHGRAPTSPAPLSPAAVTLNADGLVSSSNTTFSYSPPDTTGAIGPDYYFEFVNGVVSPRSRTTLASLGSAQLDAFSGPTGRSVFDPQVQWSQEAGRWFYAAISDDGDNAANKNFLLFGFSKSANASGSLAGSAWCRYAISTGTVIDDYPKLGHSANHIIIGSNVFTGNTFDGARIWALPKPANGTITNCPTTFGIPFFGYNGTAGSALKTADNDTAFTPVPANTVAAGGGGGYVVAADDPTDHGGTSNQIMVWHVAGTTTSPTLVQDGDVSVTNYQVPANVPQPGTTRTIDSSDARLTQAVAQPDPDASGAEAIWTQHTIDGSGTPSVVRWYELVPSCIGSGSCTAKRQEGTVVGTNSSTDFTFNGAISPTTAGNSAMIDYNQGSSNTTTGFVSVRVQSRVGATAPTPTPLNTMANESTLITSTAIDRDFSCSPCRWGDYAAASPDPSNSSVVWGSNQYNGSIGTPPNTPAWRTRNFEITP